jgi:anti-anti-sigma factor
MARCFVVQGFGKKTDYASGRVLNLDASYAIIKEAVEQAGHECLRADEIVHSGNIDQLMYEQLLRADLVIADLSTQNLNAAFELGVRYGLRPNATIIVAEEGFNAAFDVNHQLIRRYKHLGEDVGRTETLRFQKDLQTAIAEVVGCGRVDSPVYSLLKLQPPSEVAGPPPMATAEAMALPAPPAERSHSAELRTARESQSERVLLELAQKWIRDGRPSDFVGAVELLNVVHERRPRDCEIVNLIALATYRSEQPTALDAAKAARDMLMTMEPKPEFTNHAETLSLWGAFHKALWDLERLPEQLSESILAYSRGFALKQDYQNGVRLAGLLELRGLQSASAGARDDAIADRVLARRVRQDVLRFVKTQLDDLDELPDDRRASLAATMWAVHAGLGDDVEATRWQGTARTVTQSEARLERTLTQIERMRRVQAELATALGIPAGVAGTVPASTRGALQLQERTVGGVVVLSVAGEMKMENCGALKERVRSLLEQDRRNVVLDLGQVPWMDSAGLGQLVSVSVTTRNAGGLLKLVNLTRRVKELLTMTRLAPQFDTYDSEGAAIASFSSVSV